MVEYKNVYNLICVNLNFYNLIVESLLRMLWRKIVLVVGLAM